eukprot:COSAG04_NODE_17263_length_474_cov_0.869333_1_plen_70_part_01
MHWDARVPNGFFSRRRTSMTNVLPAEVDIRVRPTPLQAPPRPLPRLQPNRRLPSVLRYPQTTMNRLRGLS